MVTALKSENFKHDKPRRRTRQDLQHIRHDSSQEAESALSAAPETMGEGRTSLRARTPHSTHTSPSPTIVDPQVVTALPQVQGVPGWLKLLVRTHRASIVLTIFLVSSVLATYSWTVMIQQQWGREFRRLESLKKHERQLIAGNEAIKNQMAQQAESPVSGLMVPDPSNAFFLAPAPKRPPAEPPRHPEAQPVPTRPLGY